MCVVATATGAAFYGASGDHSPPPRPVQSATPGEPCTPGAIGAYSDHVYECVGGKWT